MQKVLVDPGEIPGVPTMESKIVQQTWIEWRAVLTGNLGDSGSCS